MSLRASLALCLFFATGLPGCDRQRSESHSTDQKGDPSQQARVAQSPAPQGQPGPNEPQSQEWVFERELLFQAEPPSFALESEPKKVERRALLSLRRSPEGELLARLTGEVTAQGRGTRYQEEYRLALDSNQGRGYLILSALEPVPQGSVRFWHAEHSESLVAALGEPPAAPGSTSAP